MMQTIGKLLVAVCCLLVGTAVAESITVIVKSAVITGGGNGTITPTGTAYIDPPTNFEWRVEITYGFINAQGDFQAYPNGEPFIVPITPPQAPNNSVDWTGPQQVVQPGWSNIVVQAELQRRLPPAGPWIKQSSDLEASEKKAVPEK